MEEHVAEYLSVRFNVPSPLRGRSDGGASHQEHDGRPPHPGPLPRGEREPFVAGTVSKLAHLIHRRTDGNPLFMVNVVNDLIAQGVLAKTNGEWELRREVSERT